MNWMILEKIKSFTSPLNQISHLPGLLRATIRLGAVLLITGLCSTTYLITTIFLRFSWKRFERETKRWAEWLTKILNIIILQEGEIPGGSYLIVSNHRSYIDIPVL